jgi:hypothetical protein
MIIDASETMEAFKVSIDHRSLFLSGKIGIYIRHGGFFTFDREQKPIFV